MVCGKMGTFTQCRNYGNLVSPFCNNNCVRNSVSRIILQGIVNQWFFTLWLGHPDHSLVPFLIFFSWKWLLIYVLVPKLFSFLFSAECSNVYDSLWSHCRWSCNSWWPLDHSYPKGYLKYICQIWRNVWSYGIWGFSLISCIFRYYIQCSQPTLHFHEFFATHSGLKNEKLFSLRKYYVKPNMDQPTSTHPNKHFWKAANTKKFHAWSNLILGRSPKTDSFYPIKREKKLLWTGL